MSRFNRTFAITGGGGSIVTGSAWELPAFGSGARLAVQYVLESMTGGTSPVVVTQLEVSNDGIHWSGLDVLGLAQSEAQFTVVGSKWLLTSDSKGTSQAWPVFRYMRQVAIGAGTVAPTAYTIKAHVAVSL